VTWPFPVGSWPASPKTSRRRIDPAQLLKATYDSGVTAAEMDVTARGKIVKGSSGGVALQIASNRSFALVPNELTKGLDSLAGSQNMLTVRGQLFKKPPGKKQKIDTSIPLKLLILDVEKKE
jgi:hypothetical protein